MSDEEKKAIEYLKRHIIPCYGRKGTIEFMLNDIVLNLIEKQSKEIEELKEKRFTLFDTTIKATIKINDKKWEDKIKARIEELEKLDFGTDLVSQFTANLTTITILQSLLEKE